MKASPGNIFFRVSRAGGKARSAWSFLYGRPLASDESKEERVGPLAGLPILGLDALASAAYGPEAALTVLLPVGMLGLSHILPISAVIVALLALVYFSYRQTISAYPNGGGSYTVAKENLGSRWGLLAAAALSLDYMLNVAVAISAGVGALVSAVPSLLPKTLPLCLLVLVLLMVINIRGVRAAGAVFMSPAYLFVATLFVVISVGVFRTFVHQGHPPPIVRPPQTAHAVEMVSLWLLVRAFAAGCTAMTGVEAVSNGVPIFKKPSPKRAKACLTLIIAILVSLLLGIAFLSHAYRITATEPGKAGYQSILSQLTAAVLGRGWFYDVTLGSVVAVLMLSANTSFADFPRLCRLLALDRFLPEPFMHQGRRLVYNHGIYVLAALSAVLLVVFGGVTDKLIPLFAVGAFLAFTLSQTGMVVHWRKQTRSHRTLASQWVNGLGAVGTGITVLVVLASKFIEGAWISALLVGAMMALFLGIRSHYDEMQRALASRAPLEVRSLPHPIVVVPLRAWNVIAQKALNFAINLSPDVYVVQVVTGDRAIDDLSKRWSELVEKPCKAGGKTPPKLMVLKSEYRTLFQPLLDTVKQLAHSHSERYVAVVIPELVERRWYHYLLHSHTASMLKGLLLFRGEPRIVVVNTPWYWKHNQEIRRAPMQSPGCRSASAEV